MRDIDPSRSKEGVRMKQEGGGMHVTIYVEDTTSSHNAEGDESKKNQAWLKKKLDEKDNLAEEGEALIANMIGLVDGPTIFKRGSKTDGHREIPKPRAVAIGPYHRYCKNPLKFDDDYKLKIARFMVQYHSLNAEKYLKEMEESEEAVRSCYDKGLSEWSSEELPTMLLLDSSLILFVMDAFCEKLLMFSSRDTFMEYMALYLGMRAHAKQIKLDLLILDNQIPFPAIKKLQECFPPKCTVEACSIKDLALSYFDDLWPMRDERQKMDEETDINHLLHLVHRSRIPVEGYEMDRGELSSRNTSQEYIPSATELQKSAMKFKKKDKGSNVDITFTRTWTKIFPVINIPTVHLYDYSEEIFRNLIAFEGNPTNNVLYFTAYLACMSCLLQREEDVKLLRESGILASTGYDDAKMVQFFKDFNQEVQNHTMPDTLLDLYGRVMEHHDNRVSKAYGGFKMQYCPNMWVGLSLVAASMLFILTLLQTIYAMIYK